MSFAHLDSVGRRLRPEPRSRARAWVTAIGVLLGVVGAATVAALALGRAGGVSASGASGPEAALERLVEAANAEDLLGVVATMAPDEVPDLDTVVEQLQAEADEAGISGLDSGEGVDVEVVLSDVSVSEQGENAAIVEFALDGSLDSSALAGPLGELLPEVVEFSTAELLDGVGDSSITEIFVVTVRLDGEWYISPMLTAGEYAVRAMNLLPGDYDLIGAETATVGAESGDAAVAVLLQGVADLDVDDVADVLASGEARVAMVFEDAIDDLLFELPMDLFTNLEVETSALDDGRVRLREASFTLSYYDEWDGYTRSVDIEVDDDCVTTYDYEYGGRERMCVSRIQPYYDPSDGGVVFATAEQDARTTVDLVGTVSSLALDALTQVEWEEVIDSTDLARYGEPEVVEVPADIEVDFDGEASTLYEFSAEPGLDYSFAVDGRYGDADVYIIGDDGAWDEEWDRIWSVDTVSRVRVLVTSESNCNDYYCMPSGDGVATVRLGILEHQTAEFPLDTSGELGPGQSISVDFTVTEDLYAEVQVVADAVPSATGNTADGFRTADLPASIDEASVNLDWQLIRVDDGTYNATWDLPFLAAGQYELQLTNYGSAAATYRVSVDEVEPLGPSGVRSVTRTLNGDGVRIEGETAPGEWFSINARPEDGQDLVLSVFDNAGATLCSVDSGYGGSDESCSATADATGRFAVEVYGYEGSDLFGDVVVTYGAP